MPSVESIQITKLVDSFGQGVRRELLQAMATIARAYRDTGTPENGPAQLSMPFTSSENVIIGPWVSKSLHTQRRKPPKKAPRATPAASPTETDSSGTTE